MGSLRQKDGGEGRGPGGGHRLFLKAGLYGLDRVKVVHLLEEYLSWGGVPEVVLAPPEERTAEEKGVEITAVPAWK